MPDSSTPSESIQWAEAPFDKKNADVILRSSDNVHFRLHKVVLADASPVFDDMFVVGSPSPPAALTTAGEQLHGLPVVSLDESSSVLYCLLQLYHVPFSHAFLPTIDNICGAIIASQKYHMSHAKIELKKLFATACKKGSAMQAYTIACINGLPEEMEVAAKASLSQPQNLTEFDQLGAISGSQILKLLRYRQLCADAADTVFDSHLWKDCKGFNGSQYEEIVFKRKDKRVVMKLPSNLKDYFQVLRKALAERPDAGVVFEAFVHALLHHAVYSQAESIYVLGSGQNEMEAFEMILMLGIDMAISEVDFASA
ncbi:hypothetical protein BC835DRAFT_1422863 [Cytidiella melzeri]|nr:hypothetical protein BC835DRAFT_1422863 [Cytidiella melzeri]